MTISKRNTVSGVQISDSTIGGFSALFSLAQPSEEVREASQKQPWPIWRAILFWIGLSAVGWTAVVGLAVYFVSLLS